MKPWSLETFLSRKRSKTMPPSAMQCHASCRCHGEGCLTTPSGPFHLAGCPEAPGRIGPKIVVESWCFMFQAAPHRKQTSRWVRNFWLDESGRLVETWPHSQLLHSKRTPWLGLSLIHLELPLPTWADRIRFSSGIILYIYICIYIYIHIHMLIWTRIYPPTNH